MNDAVLAVQTFIGIVIGLSIYDILKITIKALWRYFK